MNRCRISWGDGIILHESRVPTSEKEIAKKQEALPIPYNMWSLVSCKKKGSQDLMKWTVRESVEGTESFSMSHEFPQVKKWLPKNRRLLAKHYWFPITFDHSSRVKKKEVTIGWNEPLQDQLRGWNHFPWGTGSHKWKNTKKQEATYKELLIPYNLWPLVLCKEKGSHNWMKWTAGGSKEGMGFFPMSHK